MGLLDFDLDKVLQNPAFMLGMNIHGANTGNYGQLGPALSGGMNQYAQQQAMMQKLAQQKAQTEWMKTNGYGGMPVDFALAKYKNDNKIDAAEYGTTPQYDAQGNAYLVRKDGTVKKVDQNFVRPQFVNFGGYQAPVNTVTGRQTGPQTLNTLPPAQLPSTKQQQKIAEVEGAAMGEDAAMLRDMERNMPQLKSVIKKMDSLADDATYTMAGQARDWALRQSGAKMSESGVARSEYVANLDNVVLPLLRQTFGAAFTAEEGNRLRATLGDPDASPQEKKAALRAFVEQKEMQVMGLQQSVRGSAVSDFDDLWGE